MSEETTHKLIDDSQSKRTKKYYDKLMSKFCGPGYKDLLKPQIRDQVKQFLRNNTGTAIVTGGLREVKPIRAEIFNIIVHNNMSAVRTNDTELIKLNFHELGELPDTNIENFTELYTPDFLWIDICTTKNRFVPHQIMLTVERREESGKRTIIYSPDLNDKTLGALYESAQFVLFLKDLEKENCLRSKDVK